MRFQVFATDFDGTLAHDGRVDPEVIDGLQRLRASGRTLVLVTGRELPDLLKIFPAMDLFQKVVAENGALLYTPTTRQEKVIGEKPADLFLQTLIQRGVEPLSQGRVIIATRQPHEKTVLELIKQLGLELTISFNKGAVMILPSGVNKAVGLAAALNELGLSADTVVGIGDGENDHAFLKTCGCAVAVSNAIPMLKQDAHIVLDRPDGIGIVKLINDLITHDLQTYKLPEIASRTSQAHFS
jgi:HAD superfamily hydrolase (TIGR01484 family)